MWQRWCMERVVMSQIRFEQASPQHQCLHHCRQVVSWRFIHMRPGFVLHQKEPWVHCTSIWSGLMMGLRISSWYLTAVKVPLASTRRAVRPYQEMPPQTMTDPPPSWSCWMMLQAAWSSPQCLQTVVLVTSAQCEPEHRAPVVSLPILMFSGKCQLHWSAIDFEPRCVVLVRSLFFEQYILRSWFLICFCERLQNNDRVPTRMSSRSSSSSLL